MRARSKAARKQLNVYTQIYGFRTPYQVLIDDEFCRICVTQKIDGKARLEKLLSAPVKLMISQCCVEHLYADGKAGAPAIKYAKEAAERRKCNHWQTKASADECIAGLIGDKNLYRYVVATQSAELRAELRKVPGTPLVYLNARSVLLLEPPSEATIAKRQSLEEAKLHVPAHERTALASDLAPIASTSKAPIANTPLTVEQVMSRRKRKVKGPNPLSVKKKTTKRKREDEDEPSGPQQDVQTVGRDAAASTTRKKRKRTRRGRDRPAGDAHEDESASE